MAKKPNDLKQVIAIEAVAAQMESALQPLLAALRARDAQQAKTPAAPAPAKPAAKAEPAPTMKAETAPTPRERFWGAHMKR